MQCRNDGQTVANSLSTWRVRRVRTITEEMSKILRNIPWTWNMKPQKEMGEKYKIWIEIQNINVLFVCVLVCCVLCSVRTVQANTGTLEHSRSTS